MLNWRYTAEIAWRWNKKDRNSGYQGYVTRFEVEDSFLAKYDVHTVGRLYHQEYWIPAEDMAAFNRHIIGKIQVMEAKEI